MTLSKLVVFGVLFLVALGAIVATFFLRAPVVKADQVAEEIIAACKTDPKSGGDQCYEKRVPDLYPDMPMRAVFDVIREIRHKDPSYQFCHVLAHKLGERIVAEDPSRWIEVMSMNPEDGLCSNGFIHGIIVGRFRDDVLDDERLRSVIPDFARACEPREDWQPTPLDQAICYHGMGHLYMFITNADYERSLETCDATTQSATGNFMRVCREGVFMQTYQPLEPDDFALIELLPEKPGVENYRRICAQFPRDEDEGACLREAWPLFRESLFEPGGAAQFCSGQPNEDEKDACYDSVFAIVGRQSLSDADKAVRVCSTVPSEEKLKCFSSVAGAILEEDRASGQGAIDFCERAGEELSPRCLRVLADRARFVFGDTPYRTSFCALLPDDLAGRCTTP